MRALNQSPSGGQVLLVGAEFSRLFKVRRCKVLRESSVPKRTRKGEANAFCFGDLAGYTQHKHRWREGTISHSPGEIR
ncbi:hypothetical protein M9458_040527, partial [Cirrhinus mrigala]